MTATFRNAKTINSYRLSATTSLNKRSYISSLSTPISLQKSKTPPTSKPVYPTLSPPSKTFSYLSISLIMAGVVLSRAGLWITDLTIGQLMQEHVQESERGTVGGCQSALNSLMDLTHYILTIFLPGPHEFGSLMLVSVGSITAGYLTYIVFYLKKRKDIQ